MKKKIAAVLLVMCALFLLTACGDSSIVGKWKDEPTGLITMEFKADGTLNMTTLSHSGTVNYKIDDDKIIMDNGTWTFKIEGNKLTLTTENGNAMEFVRE